MENSLLAAVLIVKDEEDDLPGALESLRALGALLSEIVVYDTGSTDRTVALAQEHGGRVVEGYWDQDFARARNDATAATNAKWVLSLDADERVVADTVALAVLLRRGLTENMTGWDVANVMILDVDAHGAPLARHPFCKLFRPSRARWTSPIHETLAPVREGRELAVVELPESVIHLRHHGYAEAERRLAKAGRNASVAHQGLDVAADTSLAPERRAKLLTDEGRSLAAAGDLDAAAECYEAALAVDGVDLAMRIVVVQDAVGFFTMQRDVYRAERLIAELDDSGADEDVVRWLRANLLIDSDRPREALPLLRGLRAVRLTSTLELDGSIAVATLMRAAVAAGEFDEALACAIQLVGSTGEVERYGPQLMRLWGAQPPALLAELLSDIVGPRRTAVAEGLRSLPAPAPAVAAALTSAVNRAATTPTRPAGASFFG